MARLLWTCLAALACVAPGWPQSPTDELPNWVLQLSRIKRHLRSEFEHVPNYVCVETVDRFHTARGTQRVRRLDTLRLEVAFVGGKELYSKAGGGQLTESDPGAFITQGAISTGAFYTTALNLFVNDAARTTGHGEETEGGKRLLRYDYEISQMLRPFHVSGGAASAWVGERGSFRVDAQSLDLLEIADQAIDIPVELGIKNVRNTVRFARVRIGASDVLLPQTAETVVTQYDGSVARNLAEFSGCREYASESKITFDPEPLPTPPRKKK